MENRIPKSRLIYIAFAAIFLAGLIAGTFVDLNFSKGIVDPNNVFGKIIAVFGMLPISLAGGLFAGGLFALAFYKYEKTSMKVICLVLGLLAIGGITYTIGHEMDKTFAKAWLSYILSFCIILLCAVLGFLLIKRNRYVKNIFWVIIVFGAVTIFTALLINIGFKLIWSRCRPRFVLGFTGGDESYFTNWYTKFPLTQELKTTFGKDEFKSFPSGHTASAMTAIYILPLLACFDTKLAKHQWWLILIGGAWAILVAFGRIVVGAHFLSDVSFGALLALLFGFIGDVIIFKVVLKEKKEVKTE